MGVACFSEAEIFLTSDFGQLLSNLALSRRIGNITVVFQIIRSAWSLAAPKESSAIFRSTAYMLKFYAQMTKKRIDPMRNSNY